jgi:hypothetical protein
VDRGEDVVTHDTLGDQDGVLEVVAIPRHERHEHVAAERQLAEIGGRTVSDDIAFNNHITHLHDRALVDAGVLVRAAELGQTVDVDAGLALVDLVGRADHDTGRVDLLDHACPAGNDGRAESRATTASMPVPTNGASDFTSGTA